MNVEKKNQTEIIKRKQNIKKIDKKLKTNIIQ